MRTLDPSLRYFNPGGHEALRAEVAGIEQHGRTQGRPLVDGRFGKSSDLHGETVSADGKRPPSHLPVDESLGQGWASAAGRAVSKASRAVWMCSMLS